MSDAPKFHRFYDGAVPPDLCKRIIDTFEKDSDAQDTGKVLGGGYSVNPNLKKTTDIHLTARLESDDGAVLWGDIDEELYDSVKKTWAQYQLDQPSLSYLSAGVGLTDTGYQVQRYTQNDGRFGPHIDNGHISSAFRIAAAVIYFNTVEEGGGTHFPHWGDTVDAVEGRILWFPAGWTHVHEGLIPVSGPKYIASTFMCYKGYELLDPTVGEAYKAIQKHLRIKALRRSKPRD